jgi:tetratricopeptide (TPR) repeat protein
MTTSFAESGSAREKTVFISYRRSVGQYPARAVFQDLVAHGYDAFLDVESIDSGVFETIILNQIAARAHFLVILAPGSLERCTDSGDWVRREIERAMDLERNIVPVMFKEFSFSLEKKYLTGKLESLSSYSALNVPGDYFYEAMAKLSGRFLKQPVYGTVISTPLSERDAVESRINAALTQPEPTSAQISAYDFYSKGYQCYELKDLHGAILNFTRAIESNPEFSRAYYNRGIAYLLQGNPKAAYSDLERTIELDPNDPYAYHNRGVARHSLGDPLAALEDYDKAIALKADYTNAYFNRGLVRKQRGQLGSALDDFQMYLKLGGDQVSITKSMIKEIKSRI